jgi:phosphoribosylformylglycinamidine synthase
MDVSVETAKSLGLTAEEFDKIQQILGRMPNFTELSIFSVMWSEHCSYKNSILQLKTLPRSGKRLLVAAGEENAGLVDIGGGLGCVFKIESHLQPSSHTRVQPQGLVVFTAIFSPWALARLPR